MGGDRRWLLVLAALLGALLAVAVTGVPEASFGGPRFSLEPPGLVQFTNTSGARLDCRGAGRPPIQVHWTLDSGDTVSYVAGVREALANGSLYFHPFPARLFRLDVHGGRYRCVVTSPAGTIISRTVRLRPVVLQEYEVTVADVRSPLGQTALFTCHVPAHVRTAVKVTSWAVDGALSVYPTLFGDEKHHMLPSGELLVRDVTPDDVSRRYLCRTVHVLTDQHAVSQRPASIVTDESFSATSRPRIVASSSAQQVREGEEVVLFCVVHSGQPRPTLRWTRPGTEDGSGDGTVVEDATDEGVTTRGSLLVLRAARPEHSGRYSCHVQTETGRDTADVYLQVLMALSVSVSPPRQTVNRGEEFRLTCAAPRPASLHWLRDGVRVDGGHQLTIAQAAAGDQVLSRLEGRDMKLSDQGMYQCFASSKVDSVQAAAQLLLGDSHPVLLDRFINHTVQPFSAVALKCVANASPTPQIRWKLDGYPLLPDHRRLIGQYVTTNNDVISHVNISSVQPVDGGWVTCYATNRFGTVSHTARLNVYGDPLVRDMPEQTAIEGEAIYITCAVGGYPIHEITWTRGDQTLPADRHQTVFPNGTLLISHVQREQNDSTYTCTARGDRGTTASGKVTLKVIVPPTIRAFMVGNYSVGERVQVLCFVKSGDTPLTLTWLRDGRPLDDPEIELRASDRYSSSLFIERVAVRHAGNYTCRAENAARASSYTAQLRVNVPPQWTVKPRDVSAPLGASVVLPCAAQGFPTPEIRWKKKDVGGFELPVSAVAGVQLLENGSLAISQVTVEHGGAYLCEASNGIGVGLSALPRLDVFALPSFASPSQQFRIREGQNKTLTCDPAGDEPITVQWFRHSQPLQTSARLLVHHWTSARNQTRSDLQLLHAVPPDSGFFSCLAENRHGSARLTVALEVEDTPLPPSDLRVTEVGSRSVTLEWRRPEPIGKHVTGYLLQYTRQAEGWDTSQSASLSSGRHQLRGLRPDTEYLLRALTLTALGPGPPSRPLTLRTDEEAPSRPPQALSAAALTSTQVKVTWRPPPADARHGLLLGYRVLFRRVSSGGSEDPSSPSSEDPAAEFDERSAVHNVTATSATLTGLSPHTWYQITVQAYNGRGFSPRAAAARARTLEDVPSEPPRRLTCAGAGPRRVSVSWEQPPAEALNGRLRGYQVKTEAVDEVNGELFFSSFDVTGETSSVEGLLPNSNYSVRVAAATGVGAGPLSQPVFCSTHEDVPEEPAAVGVVVTSSSAALVSWLPPHQSNGAVTSYNVYIRTITYSDETREERRAVPGSADRLALHGLSLRSEYAVRVAARTAAGEGQRSRPVRFTTSENVSAQVTALSRPVSVAAGSELILSCRHVGQPPLQLSWRRNGQPLTALRYGQLSDDQLTVTHVTSRDSGNYSCHVTNAFGADHVTYEVTVLDVPPAPALRVTDVTSHSVSVRWSSGDPGGLAIRQYRLQFWPAPSDGRADAEPAAEPAEVLLERFVREHQLSGLLCGTVYQLRLRAVNRLGASEPSATVEARTAGRPPRLAEPDRLLTVNSSGVTVQLHLWSDERCALTRFTVRWRPASGAGTASVELAGHTRQYVIRRPMPPADYVINVTAVSPAGVASHSAVIRTVGSAADVSAASGTADVRAAAPSFGLRVVVPVLAGLVSLAMVASAGYLCVRRRRSKVPLYLSEPPSYDGRSSQYSKAADTPQPPQSSPPFLPPSSPGGGPADVCPYATFYPAVGSERTLVGGTGHYAALLPLGTSAPRRDKEGRYADPRHHLSTLPVRQAKFQRGRSLPASDEYDSPEEPESDSTSEPGRTRSSSMLRGQHSFPRDMSRHAESSSSSCQLSPDLRSRSFTAKRTRRKRRRARTPVLVPPTAEYLARVCPPPPAPPPADADSRLLQQLKLQQELSQLRPAPPPDAELELRALAHRLNGGQDFSINV